MFGRYRCSVCENGLKVSGTAGNHCSSPVSDHASKPHPPATPTHSLRTSPKGCSAPLVVKIADTDKEKAQKRLHQAMTSIGNQFGGLNNLTAFGLGMNTAAYYQQVGNPGCLEAISLSLSLFQLLQLQQASQGPPTASNSFGLGTAGMTQLLICDPSLSLSLSLSLSDLQALAALNQQSQVTQVAAAAAGPPGQLLVTSLPITSLLHHPGMGNLGSAVLSATTGQHKLGLGNDSLMQAYVGMQTPTGKIM